VSRLALLVLCAVLALPGLAVAAKRHAHPKDVTVRGAIIEPLADGRMVAVGLMSDGAVVHSRATLEDGTFKQRSRAYYPDGSIVVSRETYTASSDGNGGLKITGTGRDVGGTKRFKGITGTYTMTGSQPAGSNVFEVHLVGKRIY
jgi:hypothetical protein